MKRPTLLTGTMSIAMLAAFSPRIRLFTNECVSCNTRLRQAGVVASSVWEKIAATVSSPPQLAETLWFCM